MGIRWMGWGTALVLWSALALGCANDDVYIKSEHVELRGSERIAAGGGCALAVDGRPFGGSSGGSSGSGTGGGDLDITEQSGDDGYLVVVSSQGDELVRRMYPASFLRSGSIDRFEITTHGGRRFELAYRGATDCDDISFGD
jgi:hypothetical protein